MAAPLVDSALLEPVPYPIAAEIVSGLPREADGTIPIAAWVEMVRIHGDLADWARWSYALMTRQGDMRQAIIDLVQFQSDVTAEFNEESNTNVIAREAARSRIERLQNELQELRQLVASTTGTTTKTTKSEKLKDPEAFDGTRSDLDRFKADVHIKLSNNADRFSSEKQKIDYIFSLTKGIAKTQLLPLWTDPDLLTFPFATPQSLLDYLTNIFGDADRQVTAQNNIDRLRQRNREFSVYYAEFAKDIEATGYNDAARKAALLRGLSDELENALVTIDLKKLTLQELVATCTRVDSRLRTLNQSTTRRVGTITRTEYVPRTPAPRVNITLPAASSLTTSQGGDKMDLSSTAARRGPLTEAERTDRRNKGLCLYCGDGGHLVRACPKKPKFTLRTATTTEEKGKEMTQ